MGEHVNIWALPIGGIGIGENGTEYTVLFDQNEKRPMLGVIPVRTCEDQYGKIHKFIRGIDIEPRPTTHKGE